MTPLPVTAPPVRVPSPLLRGALPELLTAYAKLEQLAAARGIVFTVADFGGVRSEADTAKAMRYREADYAVYVRQAKAAGRTPLDKYTWRPINVFGSSWHNFGAAFDVAMVHGSLAELAALAPSAGLRAGYYFKTRQDPPHFELPITLLEARARWLARGNAPGIARAARASLAALVLVALVGGAVLVARGVPAWR